MDAQDRFKLLTAVALVDARLEQEEQQVLLRAAKAMGLARGAAEEIVRDMLQGGRLTNLVPPADPAERRALFDDLVRVVLADGVVSPQERTCLARLAPSFGVAPAALAAKLDPPSLPDLGSQPTVTVPPPVPGGRGGPPPLPGSGGMAGAAMAGAAMAGAQRPSASPSASPPRSTGRKKAPSPKTGESGCPSCGAPVEFKNARSVAAVCAYCDTTVARSDRGDALEDLGKISHVVEDASPIQLGSSGKCFGVEFLVIGRLQVQHEVGFWNEWYLQWADRRTGWLGEALGQYMVTFPDPADGKGSDLPSWDGIAPGSRVLLAKKPYTVTDKRIARATGTQGETPFAIGDGYELPYADLRRPDAGFATIDYSEDTPLVFVGRCFGWKDLNLRSYRRFHGW